MQTCWGWDNRIVYSPDTGLPRHPARPHSDAGEPETIRPFASHFTQKPLLFSVGFAGLSPAPGHVSKLHWVGTGFWFLIELKDP